MWVKVRLLRPRPPHAIYRLPLLPLCVFVPSWLLPLRDLRASVVVRFVNRPDRHD